MPRVPIPDHPGFWRRGQTVYFKYRDQRGRQRWGTASTIRAAKRKRASIETDVARGEWRPRSTTDFATYARAWVKTYTGRTSRPINAHTRADYERRLEQDAIAFFGTMRLIDVEPQDVKAYAHHVAGRKRQDGRGEGLSANSVRLALAPVKAMFATAFEEGVIRVNPAAGVRIAVQRTVVDVEDEDAVGEVRALSAGELAQLLAHVRCERCSRLEEPEPGCDRCAFWLLFLELLAQLGVRIGELVELRWRDVDLGARTVKIRRRFYRGTIGPPKSRYGRRTLKLPAELAAQLWRHRKETRAGDGDLVFGLAGGGRVDPSNAMSRVLKPAARRAGVGSWVGFHTFRHTCATLLFKAGWNPKQVQLYLGHHSAAFTLETYIHLLPGDVPEPPQLARGTRGGTQRAADDPRSAGVDEPSIAAAEAV